ncbi:hypothetical protein FB45DRAFT_760139 [Roridomyces roridus]|uniref:Uncharacterized protein n=1 Tax=Roridomyces roridus TaxID=1738132 RepID=A0AAD7FCG5_9AGAR|nr:hypothetical protein FB45DRAFT_760139 [Roridomyces roridus]
MLKKAAASSPIELVFDAAKFRAAHPRWTGLPGTPNHPLFVHARDAEYLKEHLQYVDWQGECVLPLPAADLATLTPSRRKTHVLVDKHGHVIGALVAPPLPGKSWAPILQDANKAMRDAREEMSFPEQAHHHRRAFDEGPGFPSETAGMGFGGGRKEPGNVKATSAKNGRAMDKMLGNEAIGRMCTFPIGPFKSLCYPIFSAYHRNKRSLLARQPGLRRLFPKSPSAAITTNLGPFSVSPPHADHGNKADGMCCITVLGEFDPDQGGHLVLWDYDLIVCFPPGCAILIPSAVVTHSNTPIQDGEERFSLIQYTAGGLFRWAENGYKTDLAWKAGASAEDHAARERARQARWQKALNNFSRWKDIKVGNYTGRVRAEVYAQAEAGGMSDLTDNEESEDNGEESEERPRAKKIRCA